MRRKPEQSLSDEVRATLPRVNVDDLLSTVKFYVDEEEAHIAVRDHAVCEKCSKRPCLTFCPVSVYTLDREGKVMVGHQACVECGSCRIGCPFGNIRWDLPRGGYGVAYKFG